VKVGRRQVVIAAAAAAAVGFAAVFAHELRASLRARDERRLWADVTPTQASGRLSARPHPPTAPGAGRGVIRLGLAAERDALLYVPAAYRADHPARLLVALHGAGGRGERAIRRYLDDADRTGTLVLAPSSREDSWDVGRNGFGPDVAHLDRALGAVFDRYAVDPAAVAIAGFSDGASYALSLGLANGDLFGRIIAFSPGYVAGGVRTGRPPVFVVHGRQDDILPIDAARTIVAELQRAGHAVTYQEFDGPHQIRPEDVRAAFDWLSR